MDGGKRRVIGVPVFPGPGAGSPSGCSPSSRHSDPSHTDPALGDGGSHDNSNPAGNAPASSSGLHWKLRHVDFFPNIVKGKKDDEHERFPALVERANHWSVLNPQALVFSCETVTWSGVDRTIFTDSGVMPKSMTSDKKTKFYRGLRVWYVVYDETFYDTRAATSTGPFKLGFTNYTLEGKNDNFQGLLSRINGDMFKKTVPGKILKLETLHMLSDVGEADVCAWTEQPEKSRDYVSFIRMLYLLKKEGQEDTKYGDIGIYDFVAQFDQRTPLNQGYEVYSDLWRRAARWMYITPNVRFISAQGLFVKVKKDSEGGQSSMTTLWDRCTHREHASAYGNLTHQRTDYTQILRVVYYNQSPSSSTTPAGSNATNKPVPGSKLYYKSFTPCALRRVQLPGSGSGSGGGGDDADSGPLEATYEDLRQIEDRINAWIAYSGARVHGVETVPTRLLTGGQEMLGPEATFVYNDREKNQSREYWRVNIRLYLDGEFKEAPLHTVSDRRFSLISSTPDAVSRGQFGSVTSLD